MKRTKKITSLVLALIMLVTSFAGFSTTAFAAGWASSAIGVNLNTTYTDSSDSSDCVLGKYKSYYYDAFKFTVPAKGKITIRVEAEDDHYTISYYSDIGNGFYGTEYYIYKASDLENAIYESDYTNSDDGYSTGSGYYYRTMPANLSAGTYYFVAVHGDIDYDGFYNFRINYTPSFPNTSLKKVNAQKKAFKATWKKCSGISGYQLQYSTKKNMKSSKTVKVKSSASSKTIKKLKKKKKYYVRIRTYKTVKVNGKNKTYYGKWSGKKTVKTK